MNTIKLKTAIKYSPEVIFLLFFIGASIGGNKFSYLGIVPSIVLLILIIWKNRFLALTLSILFGLGSLWMLLAAASEYKEFPQGDPAGIRLLLTGSLLSLFALTMSIAMPFKYFLKNKSKYQ